MTEREQATAARKISRARLALLIALVGVIGASVVLGIAEYFNLETLNAHRATLVAFVAAHRVIAAVTFVAVYFAGVAVGIPGWGLLTVVGGFLFGPVLGTALVVVAASAGGVVLFLLARYALRDFMRAKAAPALRKLDAGFHADAFSYMLALRLIPVLPFFVTTIAVAFMNVSLRTFILATPIGLIPVTAVYATLGAGLNDALLAGAHDPLAAARQPTVIGGLIGLALLALLPVAYRKLRR